MTNCRFASQKSLSEECEDLGVDSPSASDLFPEADILFGAPSPAHEQTIDQCHTRKYFTPMTYIYQGLSHKVFGVQQIDDKITTYPDVLYTKMPLDKCHTSVKTAFKSVKYNASYKYQPNKT